MDKLKEHWPDLEQSRLYLSKAREVEEQDDFLNLVCQVKSDKSPQDILTLLQHIESDLHKDPPYRFGPRTIDLDILLYGDQIIDEPDLTVPHPRMHERRFVLDPLCELIEEDGKHPKLGKTWKELREAVEEQKVILRDGPHCHPEGPEPCEGRLEG